MSFCVVLVCPLFALPFGHEGYCLRRTPSWCLCPVGLPACIGILARIPSPCMEAIVVSCSVGDRAAPMPWTTMILAIGPTHVEKVHFINSVRSAPVCLSFGHGSYRFRRMHPGRRCPAGRLTDLCPTPQVASKRVHKQWLHLQVSIGRHWCLVAMDSRQKEEPQSATLATNGDFSLCPDVNICAQNCVIEGAASGCTPTYAISVATTSICVPMTFSSVHLHIGRMCDGG